MASYQTNLSSDLAGKMLGEIFSYLIADDKFCDELSKSMDPGTHLECWWDNYVAELDCYLAERMLHAAITYGDIRRLGDALYEEIKDEDVDF